MAPSSPTDGDLHQILERLVRRAVATGKPSGKREELINHSLAGVRVAIPLPRGNQCVDIDLRVGLT